MGVRGERIEKIKVMKVRSRHGKGKEKSNQVKKQYMFSHLPFSSSFPLFSFPSIKLSPTKKQFSKAMGYDLAS